MTVRNVNETVMDVFEVTGFVDILTIEQKTTAYSPEIGMANINVEVTQNPLSVSLTFVDQGVPYDPLEKVDPDTTLSAEERDIGGLGIFMVKKNMDDVCYEYKDGQNILSLRKQL